MKLIPISHKKPECIGCALCAEVAPNYFEMDEDGEAQLIRVVREQGKFQFSEGFEDDREKPLLLLEDLSVSIWGSLQRPSRQ